MVKVEFTVKVPVVVKKEADIYVSCCPVLDVYSQGQTAAEARSNLVEAVKLFITTCFERGTLDAVLKQCGFKPLKRAGAMPRDHKYITVPIPFSVAEGCAEACHA